MRRRLRLRVLYWPALASAVIVALLLCTGRWEPRLKPLGEGLFALRHSGTATVGAKPLEDPGSEASRGRPSTGRPGAGRGSAGRDVRTLTVQSQSSGQPPGTSRGRGGAEPRRATAAAPHRPAPRDDIPALRERAVEPAHRRVAARAALLADAPLAAAELRAPQRQVEEELAGLDLQITALDVAPSMRLASSGHPKGGGGAEHDPPSHRAYVGDELWESSTGVGMIHRSRHGLGGSWPESPRLREDLQRVALVARSHGANSRLAGFAPAAPEPLDFEVWQLEVSEQLDQLRQLPSIASPQATAVLARLSELAQSGQDAAESLSDRQGQVICLCAAHALQRRVAVWTAAHRATSAVTSWVGDEDPAVGWRDLVERLILRVADDAAGSHDPEGWRRYLLLSELTEANQSDDEPGRRVVAQRFLSRMTWYGLTDSQRDWLQRDSVDALETAIRRWAVAPVDYASLLGQLERQESDAIDLGGIDVARAAQSLRFATSPEAVQLAETIDAHYRNANIRIAITDTLINRLVPAVDARVEPIRQQVLGAQVRGQSYVDSQLAVRLIPSASTWRLQLETSGHVRSDAASRSGPVSIRTGSHADFLSTTPLEFTRLSAAAGGTQVRVDSSTQLRGIQSDYDSVPLIGSLVREIAASRYQSLAHKTKEIQHGQIRSGVGSEVDKRVGEQLNEASDSMTRHLVGPLGSLGLNPMVVDMQTTPQRLTARYRVGGDWQLAAFTPRPRAPADSLLSLQIHQSVLNNTLETVLPSGQTKTIKEIATHFKDLFAIQEGGMLADDDDNELADDTIIHFAATRPITVEIEDDLLWITLRVMRLSREGSIDLRRFIVRAAYRCETDGLNAQLVRDGHLRISGPGMSMRDRLPVRAIFNKVFSARRPLPLTPPRVLEHPAAEGLVITQLEMRDGWIGLAIGTQPSEKIAKESSFAPRK